MNQMKPKIYVACLAAYNNGYLHGEWIKADQDVDSLYAEIRNILSRSPILDAEEWAIHDYEDFGDVRIDEYMALEAVASLANFIIVHDDLGAAMLAHVNGNIEEAQRLLDECYHGEYVSEEAFAESFSEETMSIPDYLIYYIDYEKMARDFFINDFFSIKVSHKIHVFSNS